MRDLKKWIIEELYRPSIWNYLGGGHPHSRSWIQLAMSDEPGGVIGGGGKEVKVEEVASTPLGEEETEEERTAEQKQATALKNEGNNLYRRGEHLAAIGKFSSGLISITVRLYSATAAFVMLPFATGKHLSKMRMQPLH